VSGKKWGKMKSRKERRIKHPENDGISVIHDEAKLL
jgi:hypothetical protein